MKESLDVPVAHVVPSDAGASICDASLHCQRTVLEFHGAIFLVLEEFHTRRRKWTMRKFIQMIPTHTPNTPRTQDKSFVIIWLFHVRGLEQASIIWVITFSFLFNVFNGPIFRNATQQVPVQPGFCFPPTALHPGTSHGRLSGDVPIHS